MLIGLGPKIKRRVPPVATDVAKMYGRNFDYALGIGSIDAAFVSTAWHNHDFGKNIIAVAGGHHTHAVILEDGTMYVWGGAAPSAMVAEPELVPGTWKQVSLGYANGLAIDSNDDLYVFGDNTGFKTGLNVNTGRTTVPTQLMAGTKFIKVSAMAVGGYAISSTNDLFSFGDNALGATGQGTTTGFTQVPTQVGTLKWKDVAAARDNVIGLTTDGTVYGWGSDRSDANGHTGQQVSPVAISGLPACDRLCVRCQEVSSLTPSGAFATNGDLWVWGNNNYGQLLTPMNSIQVVTNRGQGWKDFVIASVSSFGIDTSDKLWHVGYVQSDGTNKYFPLPDAGHNSSGNLMQYDGFIDVPVKMAAPSGSKIFMVPM